MSTPDEYLASGVPVECVEPLLELGYDSVDKIKALEKPGSVKDQEKT